MDPVPEGRSDELVPKVFFIEAHLVFFQDTQILLLESARPMMFGLPLNITNRFGQLRTPMLNAP